MPTLNLNLSEAQSLKPIPEDTYPAEVVEIGKVEEGPKSNYVPVKVRINAGEHEGRTFFVNLPIDGKGAGIFVDFYNKVCGTDHDVDDLEELAIDTDDMMGQELRIVIKNEEYPEGSGEIRSGVARTLKAA